MEPYLTVGQHVCLNVWKAGGSDDLRRPRGINPYEQEMNTPLVLTIDGAPFRR